MSGLRLGLCVVLLAAIGGCGDADDEDLGSSAAAVHEPCAVKCMAGFHQPPNGACACVPDKGTPCGNTICTNDEYCCNPSCSVCAPKKGGFCSMQVCSGQ